MPSIHFIRSRKPGRHQHRQHERLGKARDIEDTSWGFSTMDDALAEAAKRQGRVAIPNARPEKGSIYRADNFEFSKVGVPFALHRQRRTPGVASAERSPAPLTNSI